MFEPARQFLDNKIDRRTFITRLTKTGVSLTGAAAIANALVSPTHAADGERVKPEASRILKGMTGGDLMCEFMTDWGVPYLFGLAGSEETGFLDALVDRTHIGYATCLHESAAMAIADGYSRATGETSIVQLHSIAGLAYALGKLVGTYRDRIPVVVTAGRQATDYRGQDGFLEAANQHTIPQDYSQWVWDVMSASTIPEVMRRAFLYAEAPPGGPSFVSFSKDLWEEKVAEAEIIPRSRSSNDVDVSPPDGHVEQIVDALLSANTPPILYMGNECIRQEISAEVAGIAEATGAMVTSANKVPVVFPTTHPNYGGRYGDDKQLSKDVDTFWSIGGHMFKYASKPDGPMVPRDATTIHTSYSELDMARNYPVDLGAIASIKSTTGLVLEELKRRNTNTSAIKARQQWIGEYNAKRRKTLNEIAAKESENSPLSTSLLIIELDKVAESDADIVSEVVTSENHIRHYLNFDHTLPFEARRKNYDTTSGVLGWGIAAAIGVKIGRPNTENWCLTGDGCFNFGSQALWSASRYDANIGIIVFNNGQYQANRLNHASYNGRMRDTNKYIGVNLEHPSIDYVTMAKSYDIEGELVSDPNKLAAALQRCKRAMADGRPYLLDVKIETYFTGKDADFYDHFSIGKGIPRQV